LHKEEILNYANTVESIMKKILYKTIACLLIPSFVFAQTYSYRGYDKYIKPTDLSHLLNAIDTEVGKEIVTYVETKLGSIGPNVSAKIFRRKIVNKSSFSISTA
jgi:hypothetical protein